MRKNMPPLRSTKIPSFQIDPMLVDGTMDFAADYKEIKRSRTGLN